MLWAVLLLVEFLKPGEESSDVSLYLYQSGDGAQSRDWETDKVALLPRPGTRLNQRRVLGSRALL